jgi:hypothetical protein
MTRTAAEVEEDVVAQRNQLDRTVEALKDKMTPGQLFDEATHAMGGAGQQVFAKLIDQAKENPMPLAVMGLGLAWLMSSSPKAPSSSAYGVSAATYQQADASDIDRGGGVGDGVADAVHSIAGKASSLVSAAGQMASGAGHKASEMTGSAGHVLSDAAASVGQAGQSAASGLKTSVHGATERASSIGGQAQRQVTDFLQREPLIIGALGLFVGIALGAALPATTAEDELLGPMHDRMLDKGKDMATQALAQASDATKATLDAMTSELTAADIPGAVHNVAHAGAQAVKDALHNS